MSLIFGTFWIRLFSVQNLESKSNQWLESIVHDTKCDRSMVKVVGKTNTNGQDWRSSLLALPLVTLEGTGTWKIVP